MSSSFIEDFLDQTNNLPREIIRNLKQIKHLDELYISNKNSKIETEDRLSILKNQFLQIIRSKTRGKYNYNEDGIKTISVSDQELLKSIIYEFEYLINLSDYKIENANENIYLVEYNLKKIDQIIESFEENYKFQRNFQIADSYKNTTDKIEEYSIFTGKSKNIYEGNEKQESFLQRKKIHLSKKKKNVDSSLNQQTNLNTNNLIESLQTNTNNVKESLDLKEEPIYCVCRNYSYGKMVECDNRNCQFQWFHFDCVGLNSLPKGKWFCSNECRQTYKKKK